MKRGDYRVAEIRWSLSSLPVVYPAKVDVMNEPTKTTDRPGNQHESTYALLICSEEKSRNLLELAIHPLLMLGPLLAIWQLAQQPVNLTAPGFEKTPCAVFDARTGNIVGNEPRTPCAIAHQEIKGKG